MTTMTTAVTTQVYRVYIQATPDAIWDAITKPEWTERYGYGGRAEFDLRPGGAYRAVASQEMRDVHQARGLPIPDAAVDGEVIEADRPRRLVQTWRLLLDPEVEAEGFTRLTYELQETTGGVTKLTVIHELDGAPKLAALVAGEREAEGAGGGWAWVLSGLKTLLETGGPLPR
jgi:uncharacterized protein YndB with AHSA1/START domain